MSLKTDIEDRIDRMMKRVWKDEEPNNWHSHGFHKHFEGYKENKVYDAGTGKTKVERFYAGNYYVSPLTIPEYVVTRVVALVLLVVSFAGYYQSCFTNQIAANFFIVSAIAQAAAIVLYLWLAYVYCCFVLAGRKMTAGDYKAGSVRLIQVSFYTAVADLAIALTKLIYEAATGMLDLAHLGNIAPLLVSIVCLMAVCLMEKRISVSYQLVSSGNQDKSGIEIS